MVKMSDVISLLNSENIDDEKAQEINEYLNTPNGRIVHKFINNVKISLYNKSENYEKECEHDIEDIYLYYQDELSPEQNKKVKLNILRCDSCFQNYQSLKEITEQEKLLFDEIPKEKLDNQNIDIVSKTNGTDGQKGEQLPISIFSNLLKKIKNNTTVFGSGIAFGSLVAASIILFIIIPQQKNIGLDDPNSTGMHQMSFNEDIDTEELSLFKEAKQHFDKKEYDISIQKFKNLLEKQKNFSDAYWYLAKCYQNQNKKAEAKINFDLYLEKIKVTKNALESRIKEAETFKYE